MRALVYQGPGKIGLEDRPEPCPGAHEVLIEVTAVGICGSDIHGYTGETGRRKPGQVMGHEMVGRIVEVGEGTDQAFGLATGKIVTINPVVGCGACADCRIDAWHRCPDRAVIGVSPDISAAFADRLVAPARNVVVLSESVPEEHGALIEPLAVGFHAVQRGTCIERDLVLVIGGGPIGQACALAARRLGVKHLAVIEPQAHRRESIESLGVTSVDPAADDLSKRVSNTLGGPATLVLDAVGSTGSLGTALGCSNRDARIILVGMNSPVVEFPAYAVSTEERSIIGSFCYSHEEFCQTAEWVGTAPPELPRLIEGRVDWDGAAAAFQGLAAGSVDATKVLVFPKGVSKQ